MKSLFSFLFVISLVNISLAQSDSVDYNKNVNTIDHLLETLYGVISGEKGEERDWDLFHHLFMEGAHLIPSGMGKDSLYHLRYDTPDDYIEKSGEWLVENGFFEIEINRETQLFGNIAQVFSTYESYKSKKDKDPFMRGINSIQLLFDGERWWVVNIYWSQESEANPIPENYLPK